MKPLDQVNCANGAVFGCGQACECSCKCNCQCPETGLAIEWAMVAGDYRMDQKDWPESMMNTY